MNYKKFLIIMIFISCLQVVNPLIASKGAPAKVSPATKSKPSYYEQAKTTIGSFSPFRNSATSQMSSAQKANATSSSNTKSTEQSLNQKASTLTGIKQSYEQVKAKAVSYYQQAKTKAGSLLLGKNTTASAPVVPVENQALNSQTNPLHEKSTSSNKSEIDLSAALSSSTSSQQPQNMQPSQNKNVIRSQQLFQNGRDLYKNLSTPLNMTTKTIINQDGTKTTTTIKKEKYDEVKTEAIRDSKGDMIKQIETRTPTSPNNLKVIKEIVYQDTTYTVTTKIINQDGSTKSVTVNERQKVKTLMPELTGVNNPILTDHRFTQAGNRTEVTVNLSPTSPSVL